MNTFIGNSIIKHRVLLISICAMAIFCSCKRQYTCTCTVDKIVEPITIESNKKHAATDCANLPKTFKATDQTATCVLK